MFKKTFFILVFLIISRKWLKLTTWSYWNPLETVYHDSCLQLSTEVSLSPKTIKYYIKERNSADFSLAFLDYS